MGNALTSTLTERQPITEEIFQLIAIACCTTRAVNGNKQAAGLKANRSQENSLKSTMDVMRERKRKLGRGRRSFPGVDVEGESTTGKHSSDAFTAKLVESDEHTILLSFFSLRFDSPTRRKNRRKKGWKLVEHTLASQLPIVFHSVRMWAEVFRLWEKREKSRNKQKKNKTRRKTKIELFLGTSTEFA